MRFITLIAAFLFSGMLAAQSISLQVTNEQDQPIPFPNILFLDQQRLLIGDIAGELTLANPNYPLRLQISALGWADQVIDVPEAQANLKVQLRPVNNQLGTVVVTAGRRARDAHKVPISLSVLDAPTLEASRTLELRDLTGLIPNYIQSELGVGFQALQSIRGIQVFSENPAVATYVDGVNQLDILALGMPLVNVERIEVLRGPQGTIYGRNAMGGVLDIITKRPTSQTSGFASMDIGNFNYQRYAASVNLPLLKDQLFLSITGQYRHQDGFLRNRSDLVAADIDPQIDGAAVGGESSFFGAARLSWFSGDNTELNFQFKTQIDDSDQSGFFVSSPNDSIARVRPFDLGLRRIGSHERRVNTAAFQLRRQFSFAELSSTTTFQSVALAYEDIDDGFGLYSSLYGNEIGVLSPPQEVLTQEFRLRSTPKAGQRVEYIAGLYLFLQDAFEPTTNIAIAIEPDVSYSVLRNAGVNRGLAAYGQLTYRLTENWFLTAGLRYDQERRENTFNGFGDASWTNGMITNLRPDTSISGTFSALSPELGFRYQITPQQTLFGSYRRGFRAGGINASRLPDGVPLTFDPEYSDNFELGYKLNGTNSKWQMAVTAFYLRWQDLQFFENFGSFTFARTNVGDARSMGLELEGKWLPLTGLRLDAAVGLLSTEYLDFDNFRGGFTAITGNQLANAPDYTAMLGIQYHLPIGKNGWELQFQTDYRLIGQQFTDIQNRLEIPAYSLWNARIGTQFKKVGLFLWGRNLADNNYLIYGAPDTDFNRRARVAAPRTYGLSLQFKW
ncbi:MAG: TonB-dependent receptor [Bacteroidota bacterium]